MKPIDGLNISPWPWRADDFTVVTKDSLGLIDYDLEFYRCEDAALVSAAPELYKALYAAELELSLVAPAARCLDIVRKALAKAAGEEC